MMKRKILAVMLIALLLLPATSAPARAAAPQWLMEDRWVQVEHPLFIRGDVSGDGKRTQTDANLLMQHIAGWKVPVNPLAADINGDGTVNGDDATLLLRHTAGWKVTVKQKVWNDTAIDNPYVRAYLTNTQYATDEWDDANGLPYFTREDVSAYSQYIPGGKDKATPVTVTVAPHKGASGYKIIVSENSGYTDAKVLNATTGENKITWLKINQAYWIRTVATTARGDVVLGEKTVKTHGVRRLNPLTSVQNMRDFGGQTTADGKVLKQGLLFRSGRLMWITPEDVRLLEDVLDIKLVVGLAQNTEDETLFSDKVETYNLTEAGFGLPNGWDTLNTIETRQKYITYLRKIIEYLAQGKAVLIHCNGGADRTGLLSAMIEGLCGVSENDICKDYELTSFALESGTIQSGNPRMLSRTRLGSKNEDGTYTNVGFDSGIWYIRQQSAQTYADQWKKCLQDPNLATDGFVPLTDEEIATLRTALLE